VYECACHAYTTKAHVQRFSNDLHALFAILDCDVCGNALCVRAFASCWLATLGGVID
jgi:hypothetical protein